MRDLEVIDDPAIAAAALEPLRSRLLAELRQPASAAALAGRLGLARQKIHYHLRALEARELVRETDTRQWGGLTERRFEASAAAYVISPEALGPAAGVAEDRANNPADGFSASHLIALAARALREVGALWRRARDGNWRLATLSIDTEIRFRSAAERAAFSRDLSRAIRDLAARYHDDRAPGGRRHRLVVLAHPTPTAALEQEHAS